MSYQILLYPKSVREEQQAGTHIEDCEHPPIDQSVLDVFAVRLQSEGYLLAQQNPVFKEFAHKHLAWGMEVKILKNEIRFEIPFRNDTAEAIDAAYDTAYKLCGMGRLHVFDPQKDEWSN